MGIKSKLIFFTILLPLSTFSQDTLIRHNNYKYKLGAKFISEHSGDHSIQTGRFQVYSYGIQAIRKFPNSNSSIESGLYVITKAIEYSYTMEVYRIYPNVTYFTYVHYPIPIRFHYLSIPINYRYDTKLVYFTAGIKIDYLAFRNITNNANYLDSTYYDSSRERKLNWGLNFSLGMEKSFNRQLSLFAESRLAGTMSSSYLDRGDLLSTSFLNIGYSIGVNYKFFR